MKHNIEAKRSPEVVTERSWNCNSIQILSLSLGTLECLGMECHVVIHKGAHEEVAVVVPILHKPIISPLRGLPELLHNPKVRASLLLQTTRQYKHTPACAAAALWKNLRGQQQLWQNSLV